MKNLLKVKIAIVMVACVSLFFSCKKEKFVNSVKTERVDESPIPTKIGGYNPSYDFYLGSLNDKIVKSPGYVYQWKITDYSNTLFYPKVQFDGPDGTNTYISMTKVGSTWILNKDLMKNGRYYWRYVDNAGNPLTAWNSYVDNIKITTGNDYPYVAGQCTPNASGCTDKWDFYRYNCTSWVAHKVSQMWNTEKDFKNSIVSGGLSHAKYWNSRLQSIGYQANTTPIVGSIAYWPANAPGGIGANGHVAFVIGVTRNSSGVVTSIVISEYNGSNQYAYGTRTLYPSNSSYPSSFIHVQYRL